MVVKKWNKLVFTTLIFISFGSFINYIFFQYENYFVIIGSILFFSLISIIFEFQKITLVTQLSNKLFNNCDGLNIIYDNGVEFDFIERFLIINYKGLAQCNSYIGESNLFNKILKKKPELNIFDKDQIQRIIIKKDNMKVILINELIIEFKNIKLESKHIYLLEKMNYKLNYD